MDPELTVEVQLDQHRSAVVETASPAQVQKYPTFCNWHFLSTMTDTLKSYIIFLSCYLHLFLLFGLPIYYASQGSAFIYDAENYCATYQQWVSGMIVPGASTVLQTSGPDPDQVTAPTVLSPSDSPYNPLLKVDQAWNSYLESRLAEWKVLFTLACVFIAISVTTFQIPQVINDPLTRFFASLAVYRVFAGLIYAPTFSLYFNSKFARSVHFAFLLSKERPELCSPWTVLSLPAASLIWGMLFLVFTIISFSARTGGEVVDMPSEDLGPMLRGAIILSVLLDAVNLVWIWKLMRKFREDCLYRIRLVEVRGQNP